MRWYLLLSYLLVGFIVQAQQSPDQLLTVSGQLTDTQGKPVEFAHMGLLTVGIGWVSNEEGKFRFSLSRRYINDTIAISHVGYHKVLVPVRSFIEDGSEIVLNERTVDLPETVIFGGRAILEGAIERSLQRAHVMTFGRRLGVISFKQKEYGKWTSLDQFILNSYSEEDQNSIQISGLEIIAQRKSFDNSRFPQITSKRSKEGLEASFIGGETSFNILKSAKTRLERMDFEISDLIIEGEDSVIVISEKVNRRRFNYHVNVVSNSIVKVNVTNIASTTYYHTSMLDNKKYNKFRYYNSTDYFYNEDGPTDIRSEQRSQYIDRITGELILVHADVMEYVHISTSKIDERKKGESYLERPISMPYDPSDWLEFDENNRTRPKQSFLNDLGGESTLKQQFVETNGELKIRPDAGNQIFSEYELRKTEHIEVDAIIEELKNNNYIQGYPPDLTWDDIPQLMSIASSGQLVDKFPRNILSRFYLDECQLGIVALWLIDSIRINEGKRKRKGWFISPMPLLQDGVDLRLNKDTDDGRGFFLAQNSQDKLEKAYAAFSAWWQNAKGMSKSKIKRINPLGKTDLKWQNK